MAVERKAENEGAAKTPGVLRIREEVFRRVNSGGIVNRRSWLMMLISVVLVFCASACGSATTGNSSSPSVPSSVVIAYQPGLSSASLVVLKQRKTLESQFPRTSIQ